jgi:hypothetical protein
MSTAGADMSRAADMSVTIAASLALEAESLQPRSAKKGVTRKKEEYVFGMCGSFTAAL